LRFAPPTRRAFTLGDNAAMNDSPDLSDPQVVELLDKLHRGDRNFSDAQMRILRSWADFCLNIESASRLVRMLKGPVTVLGPLLTIVIMWKAGLLTWSGIANWLISR